MMDIAREFLNKLDRTITDDFELLNDREMKKSKTKLKSHYEFIRYLVSVATHPIGLRASIQPYNSGQEHMLAYIMDMFAINDAKLRRIITGAKKSESVQAKPDHQGPGAKSNASDVLSRKRHSWRPELRVRLSAPKFHDATKLSAKVFLFKEETISRTSLSEPEIEGLKGEQLKGRGLLRAIFRQLNSEASVNLRPSNEMQLHVKFRHMTADKIQRGAPKMVQVSNNAEVLGDLHLRIRRYYCDPNTAYVLRIEFWLESNSFWLPSGKTYQTYLKGLSNSIIDTITCRRLKHSHENKDFLGFVSINLSQIPSYAIKQNYPIISPTGKEVNLCDISLETRNRRIVQDDVEDTPVAGSASDQAKVSGQLYIANHFRLYFHCFLHQLSIFVSTINESKLNQSLSFQNITLENILYISAYSLLNQHRLQSNLDWFEDQSIRRTAVFLILNKLSLENANQSKNFKTYVMLISVILNEYLVGQRSIDDRTMQEIDPFRDESTPDSSHRLILGAEIITLENFIEKFLIVRLRLWINSDLSGQATGENSEKTLTLTSLKLCKVAIRYFRRSKRSSQILDRVKVDVLKLRTRLDQVLCDSIHDQLTRRMEDLGTRIQKGVTARNHLNSNSEFWVDMLRDLQRLNHDLCLNWSRRGLDSFIESKPLHISSDPTKRIYKNYFQKRVDNYLTSKLDQ